MTVDNIYTYLEYLALAVDQLGDAVIEREEESAVYETRLAQMGEALIQAQKELDKADARVQLAESRAQSAEAKCEELIVALNAAKALAQKNKNKSNQPDLFAVEQPAPAMAPPQASAPIPAVPARGVANDEKALILAKRLDSTIDKVQRLLAQAQA